MKIENVVVISLEDYTEYQELKNKKKEIDFSRLKTGSVVMVNYNGSEVLTEINPEKEVTILSINTGYTFARDRTFISTNYKYNLNVIQGDVISSFANHHNQDYITEVISY